MTRRAQTNGSPAVTGFGFCPEESGHHFDVAVPSRDTEAVRISELLSFDSRAERAAPSLWSSPRDARLRVALPRDRWDAIADAVRVEFNRRLKSDGLPAGRWKVGANPVARLLGKELTLLAWAIEDADLLLIPTALRNWSGLAPEERWWLFTMTAAATGDAVHGRDRGWRKAVRFALTENPVADPDALRELAAASLSRPAVRRERRRPARAPVGGAIAAHVSAQRGR